MSTYISYSDWYTKEYYRIFSKKIVIVTYNLKEQFELSSYKTMTKCQSIFSDLFALTIKL
jgi:hypothetical protein